MAAIISAAQVLGKISRDHLECSICACRFREPKALDCLHSFCLKCLQDLTRQTDPQSPKLVCPLCRRETKLDGKQVSDLPNNFTLSALIEEFMIQEQVLQSQQSQVHVICQACDERNKAISICMDCAHFLCQECQTAHKRLKLTKSHKIFTMAQLQSGEITYKSKVREEVPKCSKHPDQNLSIYCGTCELLLCTTCSLLDHPSPKHSLSGLPEAVDKCKTDIKKLAAQAEKKKTEISTSIKETKNFLAKLNTTLEDVRKKISTKASKEVAKKEEEIAKIRQQIAEIRQEEQTLQQEVQKIYKERVKIFETAEATNNNKVTQAEEKLHQTNQLMSEAICCDLLNFKQKLLFNLREISRKQPEKVPDHLSFMDFEEGERSLGKLILEDKPTVKPSQVVTKRSSKPTCRRWELRSDIQRFGPKKIPFEYADSITAFTNNEIAVLDRTHKKIITLTVTREKSQIHSQELQLPGLTSPTHVSVNKFNQLIILDSPQVKIFDRKTQKLFRQFTPGRSKPTCLAVDENNVIAVGYEAEKEISLHDQNGKCIKRLHVPMIGITLTACKQKLIYTMMTMNKLLAVDYNGDNVFSVDIPSDSRNWHPYSLCCDSNGNIYVCLYRGPQGGKIQHFSPTGEYIGCVIDECGYPGDITLTQAGDLVIAGKECVTFYQPTAMSRILESVTVL